MPENIGSIFESPTYVEARQARLRNLWAHIEPRSWSGKSVLELGSGTGELGQSFVELGCSVVSVDARPEHIARLRAQYPGRQAQVADLEQWDFSCLGYFDAILCFGLLYHLATPDDFLARCARTASSMFLETIVTDSADAVAPRCTETGSDQAFSGYGCRPSPQWIVATLARCGFTSQDISSSLANWGGDYPSVFDWEPRYQGEWQRNRSNLRKMYICTRSTAGGHV